MNAALQRRSYERLRFPCECPRQQFLRHVDTYFRRSSILAVSYSCKLLEYQHCTIRYFGEGSYVLSAVFVVPARAGDAACRPRDLHDGRPTGAAGEAQNFRERVTIYSAPDLN